MRERITSVGARIVDWFAVLPPEEPETYRGMFEHVARTAGRYMLPGLFSLIVYLTIVDGPGVLVFAVTSLATLGAAFAAGLAIRWNDRAHAAAFLGAASGGLAVLGWLGAVAAQRRLGTFLVLFVGWVAVLMLAFGHASPDDS